MDSSRLLNALTVLNSQLKLDRLIPRVLDITLDLTGADRAFLMIYENDDLTIQAGRNFEKQDLSTDDFQGSWTLINSVLQERNPLYIPRIAKDARFSDVESAERLHLKSAICIPFWHSEADERSVFAGILYVDSSSSVRELLEEHIQIMQALGNHVATSLKNVKLFLELEIQKGRIESLNKELEQRIEIQAGNLAEMRILLEETRRELGKVYGIENIVGRSKPMIKLFNILEKVVPTSASVLISGESGTGKELVTKYLHYNGPRAENALVSINCSAFAETLLESELFGHVKGAFTDAKENKMGLFELAHGGTLHLDEVGDMSESMQRKLLRVLQDGEIRPIGGKNTIRVDVRIIASTNKNLKQLVLDSRFREDLYFRLNVIEIRLPPLRERREDIPLLIDFITRKIAVEMNCPVVPLGPEFLKKFLEHDWPGNVRQMENELRRFFILESEYEFHPLQFQEEATDLKITSMERKAIQKALHATSGNKSKAAEILGMSRRAFYNKLAKYNLS